MKLRRLTYILAFGVMLAWAEVSFRVTEMGVEYAPPKGNKKLAEMVAINFMVELPFTRTTFLCRARKSDRKALPTTVNMESCFPMNRIPNGYPSNTEPLEELQFGMKEPFARFNWKTGRMNDRIRLEIEYEQLSSMNRNSGSAKFAVDQQQFRWNLERQGNRYLVFDKGAYYDYPYQSQ